VEVRESRLRAEGRARHLQNRARLELRATISQHPGEARSGAELEGAGALAPRRLEGLTEAPLGITGAVRTVDLEGQRASQPVELGLPENVSAPPRF